MTNALGKNDARSPASRSDAGAVEIEISGELLELLPDRAVIWGKERTCIIADPHFAKAQHFQRAGLGVSSAVHAEDLSILESVLVSRAVERCIVLGDLFHSTYNDGVEQFGRWRASLRSIEFVVVPGNHDRFTTGRFEALGLSVAKPGSECGPFQLAHDPDELEKSRGYGLCGHLHPGYRVGRGPLRTPPLPCFKFGSWLGLLPAFGRFTGCVAVDARPDDLIFVIADDSVIAVGPRARSNADIDSRSMKGGITRQ